MARVTRLLNEIEVDVSGFFTTHHFLRTETGEVGKFTFPAFSQQGVYQAADGRELLMQKTHWLGSAHEVIEGEMVRGTADRRGLFRRDIIVQFDGQDYTLEPEGAFKRAWYLNDASGLTLIEIQPRGAFQRGAYLTLFGAVDPDLIAFAYYLIHMRWQEDAAAASAAAS